MRELFCTIPIMVLYFLMMYYFLRSLDETRVR